jgi:hypothetical protein
MLYVAAAYELYTRNGIKPNETYANNAFVLGLAG